MQNLCTSGCGYTMRRRLPPSCRLWQLRSVHATPFLSNLGVPAEDHSPPPLAFLDVPYFEGEGACDDKHRLDVYIPAAPFPRPRSRTCLFVHGGSWQRGDRRHPNMPDHFYGNIGRAFAKVGMVGLVMSYRLAPGVQHPEQVRDVARAIRWAKDNVSRYGGDPKDLVLVGHSAGAHLASLCLSDERWLQEQGIIPATVPTTGNEELGAFSRRSPTEKRPQSQSTDNPQAPSSSSPTTIVSTLATPKEVTLLSSRPSLLGTPQLIETPLPPSPISVVSGFVGISGVYDIPRMAGNVVGGMFAKAAFGAERWAWKRASPVHCIRAASAAAAVVGEVVTAKVSTSPKYVGGSVKCDTNIDSNSTNSTASKRLMEKNEVDEDEDEVVRRPENMRNEKANEEVICGVEGFFVEELELEKSMADLPTMIAACRRAVGTVRLPPLVNTEVLLLTASSDFHLKDDAEALAQALDNARSASIRMRSDVGQQRGRGDIACTSRNRSRRRPDPTFAAGVCEGQGTQQTDFDGIDRSGREGGGGHVSARGSSAGEGGSKTESENGSVRHVVLEGEDHVSTIVSFGEPGKEASDIVLDFILSLPPPHSSPPRPPLRFPQQQ